MRTALVAALLLFAAPANAYWYCEGVLTSNNTCIGSQSNVDARDNHAPIETRRRDYVRPELNRRRR